MRIYPMNARIPISAGSVTFYISPLSLAGRMQLGEFIMRRAGSERKADLAYAMRALQLCLKKIDGVDGADGKPYQLSFDSEGFITDECLEEVQQVMASIQVASAVACMLSSMTDPGVEGVRVDFDKMYLEEDPKKKTSSPQ